MNRKRMDQGEEKGVEEVETEKKKDRSRIEACMVRGILNRPSKQAAEVISRQDIRTTKGKCCDENLRVDEAGALECCINAMKTMI